MTLMGVTSGGSIEDKFGRYACRNCASSNGFGSDYVSLASFNMFDKDGDGELDREEIEQIVLMATRVVVRKQYNAGKFATRGQLEAQKWIYQKNCMAKSKKL